MSVMSKEEDEAIQKASASVTRYPLIPVQGIPLMNHTANNWDSISAFCPDPSDILITTYPKAGTTWTQEITDLLLHNGDAEACKRAPITARSPFLEFCLPQFPNTAIESLKKMDPPRLIKTHFPIQLVPPAFWEKKCKTIYVARNAKDNLVSYYYFDLAWGSWYDHVKGYWVEKEKKNILYIFYEDMKENPQREIERIMRYLDLSLSDEVISRIAEFTSFKNMKDNPMSNYSHVPQSIFDLSVGSFMRKVAWGSWYDHVKSYWLEKEKKNILYIFYEDMKELPVTMSVMPKEEDEAIQKASASVTRYPLIPVQGIPLMNHTANNWDSISAFCPDPSDILITTYPKSGTTWTQEIIDQLLHNGDAEACKRAPITARSPLLEFCLPQFPNTAIERLEKMDPPRLIKTHLPIQLVPPAFWEKKCKTIYVARNAKDNLVSYYYFDCMNLTQPEPGPWEGYIHKYMRGELAWGSWYDHVKGYWVEKEKKNILYIFYEDMKENPRREIERIMRYLDLSLSDEVISRIVELTSFKNMKDNPMANYSHIPQSIFDLSVGSFMRKGEVGDWRNNFTPEQSKMFDEDYEKQMSNVNIPFKTLI
ncbi:hypothetical protein Q8A73_021277 [Channa argus]|nr:hypothetical protein Q8A73_021277 [Channa argus]